MKFSTNARCGGCKAAIGKAISEKFPNAEWDLDLNTADKVLEIHGIPEDAEHAAQVIKTIEETGFKGAWLDR